jgi:hypothetical protein
MPAEQHIEAGRRGAVECGQHLGGVAEVGQVAEANVPADRGVEATENLKSVVERADVVEGRTLGAGIGVAEVVDHDPSTSRVGGCSPPVFAAPACSHSHR